MNRSHNFTECTMNPNYGDGEKWWITKISFINSITLTLWMVIKCSLPFICASVELGQWKGFGKLHQFLICPKTTFGSCYLCSLVRCKNQQTKSFLIWHLYLEQVLKLVWLFVIIWNFFENINLSDIIIINTCINHKTRVTSPILPISVNANKWIVFSKRKK